MNKRFIPMAILILASAGLSQEIAAPKMGGYFSFDYSQGQEDGLFKNSRLGGLDAGLVLTGQLSDTFSYTFEARFRSESRIEIEQAWLALRLSKSLNFILGDFLVPFGRYNRANRPHETFLVQRPLVFEKAYPASWRDLGLQVSGKLSFILFAAFIGNGLAEAESPDKGQQFGDNNSDKAWGGRLSVQPDQTLDIGLSYYQGKYDDAGTRKLKMLGVDAAWVTVDYSLSAEYIKTDSANPAPWAKGVTEGFFVQLAIKYKDFSPVVSYQKAKQDDPFHGLGWSSPLEPGAGLADTRTRWALGLIYLPVSNIHLKAEYDFNREIGPALKDDLISVQATVNF